MGRVSFDLVGGGLFDTFATSEYDRSGEFNPDKSHQEWILEEVRRAVNRLHGNTNCPWVYKSTPPILPSFTVSLTLPSPSHFLSLSLTHFFLHLSVSVSFSLSLLLLLLLLLHLLRAWRVLAR